MIQSKRPAAVAGRFYPGVSPRLEQMVDRYLAEADVEPRPNLVALIAPHAGYPYSGAIAGSAYKLVQGRSYETVVLAGPSHYVPLRGMAVPSVEAFDTPLGPIPIDTEVVEQVLAMDQVTSSDVAHAQEHSLEVHLPFLQRALAGAFKLVPIVVGDADKGAVADVFERALAGPNRLLVVSTDLSHFLDYDRARKVDGETCRAIEQKRPDAIHPGDACGRAPVRGALELAIRRGLEVETLDIRNSGDTAGDRARVVGYGSWAIVAP